MPTLYQVKSIHYDIYIYIYLLLGNLDRGKKDMETTMFTLAHTLVKAQATTSSVARTTIQLEIKSLEVDNTILKFTYLLHSGVQILLRKIKISRIRRNPPQFHLHSLERILHPI